eukprot:jgi/Mesvir1/26477/Mv16147-RA.1
MCRCSHETKSSRDGYLRCCMVAAVDVDKELWLSHVTADLQLLQSSDPALGVTRWPRESLVTLIHLDGAWAGSPESQATLEAWKRLFGPDADCIKCEYLEGVERGHLPFRSDERTRRVVSLIAEGVRRDVATLVEKGARMYEEQDKNKMDYPSDKCLQDMLEEQFPKTPGKIAVYDEGREFTYKQLEDISTLLMKYLSNEGVGRETVVGILMDRCAEYVFALVAILRAGGAYMPLEIVYPAELVSRVLKESKPHIILTKKSYAGRLPPEQARLCMDDGWIESLQAMNIPPIPADKPRPDPDCLAYVVMSSGTTGVPKGICCPHRGAVHSYYWRHKQYPYEEGEREACNVFFVWEVLRSLMKGATAYVIPDDVIYDVQTLIKYLGQHSITRVLFTPSLAQLVVDTCSKEDISLELQKLKVLILCGEVVTISLRNKLHELLPECVLLNLYSVSECHDICDQDLRTLDVESAETCRFAPCGTLIPNVTCFVLDDNMQKVPYGFAGEIYIGGPCLAIGYLNQPEMTAKRFPPDPFHPGQRLYRTGDRGRILPNSGCLELMGRCDFMVKIRGYSVVLGAVEVALAEHPDISTAVVLVHGEEGEDKKLVAYVVPIDWKKKLSERNIRKWLRTKLPMYAIPSTFVILEALPVSGAGKLSRKELKEMTGRACDDVDEEGEGEELLVTEAKVAALWKEIVNCEVATLSPSDSFFEVGGHSLASVRLLARINQDFGLELALPDIMAAHTLQDMAKLVEGNGKGGAATNGAGGNGAVLDLRAEVRLEPSIYPAPSRKTGFERYRMAHTALRPLHRLLLTGASGYLGAFLLARLLASTDWDIYCLVRVPGRDASKAGDEEAAKAAAFDRIVATLKSYSLYRDGDEEMLAALEARVFPVVGDLSRPLLGLPESVFQNLAGEVDAILHNGAEVNLVKPYAALHATNVMGTQEVLRLAVANGRFSHGATHAKPVHYISTNGVFPTGMKQCLEEACLDDISGQLTEGYAQTKWVAEQLCLEARRRGLPVAIYRPGNMAGSSVSGQWNASDFIRLMIEGCITMGMAPAADASTSSWRLDLTPVDFAAAAIVHLIEHPVKSMGRVLHVQNPQAPVVMEDVFKWVESAGFPLKRVPLAEFRSELRTQSAGGKAKLQSLQVGLDGFIQYFESSVHFDSSGLHEALKGTGIDCPRVDPTLIQTYLKAMDIPRS